jgi:LemA protein
MTLLAQVELALPCCAVAVLAPLIYVVATYNRLVGLRIRVRESWSGIDTELKRRHDLIPNLVETVKGYAAHERAVLERVISLRGSAEQTRATGEPAAVADGERALTAGVAQLVAIAERYPVLRADEHFRQIMSELALTEDRIQAARRFYNANVRDLNSLCQMFPSSLIADMGSFQQARFFELESAAERLAPPTRFD